MDCLILLPGGTKWYRYDSFNHQLDCLTIESSEANDLAILAKQFFPTVHNAAVIWYVGDMTRISGKYNHAESAVWRDAGAIIATQSLVAEYLDFAFCPLGVTGDDEARTLSDERDFIGLGLALIGRKR